jgi:hypothetical protein
MRRRRARLVTAGRDGVVPGWEVTTPQELEWLTAADQDTRADVDASLLEEL